MRSIVLTIFVVLWAVVLILTGGRFLALLVNANKDSEIIQKLHDWSDFWVKPFFNVLGIENKAVGNTGGVFEPASLLAFVVYLLIGAVIYSLLNRTTLGRFRHA